LLSFGGDGEEIVDLPLPAFAHVAVGRLIARQDEGGVQANARAAASLARVKATTVSSGAP